METSFLKPKKKKCIFGIVGLIIFIAALAVSCNNNPEESNPFVGTWLSSEGGYTVVFGESIWHINKYSSGNGYKGTYTHNGNTATLVFTEINETPENTETWRPITSEESSGYTKTVTVAGTTLTWGSTLYSKQ